MKFLNKLIVASIILIGLLTIANVYLAISYPLRVELIEIPARVIYG